MPAPWPDNAFPATFGPMSGTGDTLTFTVPTGVLIQVESVYAEVSTGSDPCQPLLTVRDQSGVVIARKRQVEEISAFTSGSATWALRLADEEGTGGQPEIPRNVEELGDGIGSTLGTTQFARAISSDQRAGDGILVLAMAPSKPSALAAEGRPVSVSDSVGNTYSVLTDFRFEANPPNVNEGVSGVLFWCPASVAALELPFDGVTVTWDNQVFDRFVSFWFVRHDGGPHTPTVIDQTADNDAAVFASTQTTLLPPTWRTTRDNALAFVIFITAKAGGTGAFGAVAGFTGYFQAKSRTVGGSKQTYVRNCQTYGADIALLLSVDSPPPEVDVGWLEAEENVSNADAAPGQTYSLGANAWKGAILLGID